MVRELEAYGMVPDGLSLHSIVLLERHMLLVPSGLIALSH
jgi:hypothetical protein